MLCRYSKNDNTPLAFGKDLIKSWRYYGVSIAQACSFLEEHGIVHGDISSRNVFLKNNPLFDPKFVNSSQPLHLVVLVFFFLNFLFFYFFLFVFFINNREIIR